MTICIAIREENQISLYADGLATAGSMIRSENKQKVYKIHDGLIMACAGESATIRMFVRFVRQYQPLHENVDQDTFDDMTKAFKEVWRGHNLSEDKPVLQAVFAAENNTIWYMVDDELNVQEVSGYPIEVIGDGDIYVEGLLMGIIAQGETDPDEAVKKAISISSNKFTTHNANLIKMSVQIYKDYDDTVE